MYDFDTVPEDESLKEWCLDNVHLPPPPLKLKATWTCEADQDLRAFYGIHAEGVLVEALQVFQRDPMWNRNTEDPVEIQVGIWDKWVAVDLEHEPVRRRRARRRPTVQMTITSVSLE